MDPKEEILKIIARHLPLENYRVFLFGSRALDRARKWSDYDIGIEGDKPIPENVLVKISGDLEESDVPYKVDVVDFNRKSEKFKNFAIKNIQQWTTN